MLTKGAIIELVRIEQVRRGAFLIFSIKYQNLE